MNLNLRYNRLSKALNRVHEKRLELCQKIGMMSSLPLHDRNQTQLAGWEAEYKKLDEKEWILSCKLREAEPDYRMAELRAH